MGVKHLILTPSDFLARRFDEGYARFIERMKRRIRKGSRKLALYSFLAHMRSVRWRSWLGASASYFGFTIVVPLMLCLYPLIALGDPYTWRKVYGRLAEGVGYRVSFLLNLDMLYWFAIGLAVGWALA